MSTYFEHVGPRERVQRALNVLLEAPFFYAADDPDLFAFLRRNRAEFARFFQELYGWQLVVDARGARLYKDAWHNPALRRRHRNAFDLSRRDECLGFLLVLEFHEHLLDERNTSVDDPEPLRFQFGELFEFALGRFREELGDRAPDEDGVRRILRAIVPTLLDFRFLRELEPAHDERALVDRENLIYECLPALYLYDVRVLARPVLGEALRLAGAPDADPGEEAP
jgi:hypothetical protein